MSSGTSKRKALLLAALIMGGFLATTAVSGLEQRSPTAYSDSIRKFAIPTQTPRLATSSFDPSPSSLNSKNSSTSSNSGSLSDTTSNWAGYVSTGGTYTDITGSWKVPSVTASNETLASDATWIGIGGMSSDDLIQVGTQNVAEDGQVNTDSFYEQLPNAAETIPSVNVNAGDTITASIKELSSGEWNIRISDLTNGESYTNTVAYDSSESSAEWIEEAPSDGNTIIPLDDFGSLTFTDGTTTKNSKTVSIANSSAQALTMDNDEGQALTTTSTLSNGGEGFTVSQTDADTDDPYGSYSDISGGWAYHKPGIGGYSGWTTPGAGYGWPSGSHHPFGRHRWW